MGRPGWQPLCCLDQHDAWLKGRADGFPGGTDSKESNRHAGDPGSIPGLGKISWRREWQPTPVLPLRESQGQRNLASYSLCGCKESDATEQLTHRADGTVTVKVELTGLDDTWLWKQEGQV